MVRPFDIGLAVTAWLLNVVTLGGICSFEQSFEDLARNGHIREVKVNVTTELVLAPSVPHPPSAPPPPSPPPTPDAPPASPSPPLPPQSPPAPPTEPGGVPACNVTIMVNGEAWSPCNYQTETSYDFISIPGIINARWWSVTTMLLGLPGIWIIHQLWAEEILPKNQLRWYSRLQALYAIQVCATLLVFTVQNPFQDYVWWPTIVNIFTLFAYVLLFTRICLFKYQIFSTC